MIVDKHRAEAGARRISEATLLQLAFLGGAIGTFACLLYTSDAADERSSVDLGGRRIIKKKTTDKARECER